MAGPVVAAVGRYWQRCQNDDLTGLAAELAFRFLLALFPFGIFLASLGAFVGGQTRTGNPTEPLASSLLGALPGGLTGPIESQLHALVSRAKPDLLSIGAIAAVYAAAGGLNALMDAMNRAYEVRETRPLLARIAVAVALTFLAGSGVIAAFIGVVAGTSLLEHLANDLGLGRAASALLVLLRWPVLFALLVLAAAIVFRLAPNIRTPWRWTLVGGVVFALGWLIMTGLFALYVSRSSYGATYGPVAGMLVVLLWFYLTAIVFVAAAELVAMLAVEREPELLRTRRAETAPERAMERGADGTKRAIDEAARDTVGAKRALADEAGQAADEVRRDTVGASGTGPTGRR